MRYRQLGHQYVLRLDVDEEIFSSISNFAADRKIEAAALAGIGAAHDVVLGYYDRRTREYRRRRVPEEMEIVSLQGNIAVREGRPFPHLHVTLGGADYKTMAGHFFEGKVGGTVEIVISPLDGSLGRVHDLASGLFVWDV